MAKPIIVGGELEVAVICPAGHVHVLVCEVARPSTMKQLRAAIETLIASKGGGWCFATAEELATEVRSSLLTAFNPVGEAN